MITFRGGRGGWSGPSAPTATVAWGRFDEPQVAVAHPARRHPEESTIVSAPAAASISPTDPGRAGLWTATGLVGAARERPVAVAHLALRTGGTVARDALALAATGGRQRADELRSLDRLAQGVGDPEALAGLALAWSGASDPGDQDRGASAYLWLIRNDLLPDLPLHHQAAGQALYLAGRVAELREVWGRLARMPAGVRGDLLLDLAHPQHSSSVPGSPATWDPTVARRWIDLLAQPFVEHGLAPVSIETESRAEHLFDRLASPAAPGSVHGALVTVIVPCYRPDEGLLTSIGSMTAQTYADQEILLVDDASGSEYHDVFEQAVALDPRVRLLRLDRNGGSYLARRAAMEVASGELVTTQDADDWSHPQRLEQQVAALDAAPEAPASRSLAIRAKDDLTHQWFGYRSVRDNASSVLVRRSVMEEVGSWMPIRKSADSEYAERLARLVGPLADTGTPLAITRLRTGSLSRGDFTYQWAHPDRNAFRRIYRAWHRQLAGDGEPQTPPDSATARPSAPLPEVPPAFARGIDGVATWPDRLDVCLVGDFSRGPGEHPRLDDALLATLADRQVGLWHLEAPVAEGRTRPEMHDGWFDLILSTSTLHVVTRTTPLTAGTVVLIDAATVLTGVDQETQVRADEVLALLDDDLLGPGPAGLPTDLLGVGDATSRWWGTRPAWVAGPGSGTDDPGQEQIRTGAEELAAGAGLALLPWPFAPDAAPAPSPASNPG